MSYYPLILSPFALFVLLRFLVATVNLLTRPWLHRAKSDPEGKVSVLIPARNEERNIGKLLDALVGQGDGLVSEIIVYDDLSDDATAEVVEKVIRTGDGSIPVRLLRGGSLPPGWLGKNHACHRLAGEAKGEWFLFLDADVDITPRLIPDALIFAQKHRLALLSLFPRQIMMTPGEWMVVPLMDWILLSLLPLILVRTCRWTSFAAANGQFMLFNANLYRRYRWHEQVKGDPVEDIRISRRIKKMRLRTATLVSSGQISCRMYGNREEALNGFTRNFIQFFGNSIPWMLLFVLLSTLSPVTFILFAFLVPSLLVPGSLLLLLTLLTRLFTSRVAGQDRVRNLSNALLQQVSLIGLAARSVRYRLGKRISWKGRVI